MASSEPASVDTKSLKACRAEAAWSAGLFRFDAGPSSSSPSSSSLLEARTTAPSLGFDRSFLAASALALPSLRPSATPFDSVRRARVEDDPGPSAFARPSGVGSPEEARRALRARLEDSIRRAIGGARRVAVLCSGGLDSSAVLALAKDVGDASGVSVFAVTLDYAADGDDRPYLDALVRALGVEAKRIEPEDGEAHVPWDGVDAAPLGWPTAAFEIAMLAVAKAEGAEIVLTGGGGDELWGGNPRALARLLGRGEIGRALGAARALRGFDEPWAGRRTGDLARIWAWLARPSLARLQPRVMRAWRSRRARAVAPSWAGPATRAFVAAHAAREAEAAAIDDPVAALRPPSYEDYVAWLRHQESMAARVPIAEPFFDPDLARWVAGLPPEWLLDGDVHRGLFRAALAGLLPERVRQRLDKAAFEPALTRLLRLPRVEARLRDLASGEALARHGLVERGPFREAFEALAAHPEDPFVWLAIWPALFVESFLRADGQGRWGTPCAG